MSIDKASCGVEPQEGAKGVHVCVWWRGEKGVGGHGGAVTPGHHR